MTGPNWPRQRYELIVKKGATPLGIKLHQTKIRRGECLPPRACFPWRWWSISVRRFFLQTIGTFVFPDPYVRRFWTDYRFPSSIHPRPTIRAKYVAVTYTFPPCCVETPTLLCLERENLVYPSFPCVTYASLYRYKKQLAVIYEVLSVSLAMPNRSSIFTYRTLVFQVIWDMTWLVHISWWNKSLFSTHPAHLCTWTGEYLVYGSPMQHTIDV